MVVWLKCWYEKSGLITLPTKNMTAHYLHDSTMISQNHWKNRARERETKTLTEKK